MGNHIATLRRGIGNVEVCLSHFNALSKHDLSMWQCGRHPTKVGVFFFFLYFFLGLFNDVLRPQTPTSAPSITFRKLC